MKGSCTSGLNVLLYSCSGAANSSLWCADVFCHADRGAHPGHCRRTWLEEDVDIRRISGRVFDCSGDALWSFAVEHPGIVS